jgi:Domain of unknown function (DUF4402)
MSQCNGSFMCGAKLPKMLAWLAAGGAASLAAVAPAYAQGDTKPAEAQIAIVKPLVFLKVDDLNFGTVIPTGTAGTVTVAPSGARSKTGGVVLTGVGWQPSKFAGYGANNQIVTISLGANQINITGPGAPMRVHDFVIGSTPTVVLGTTPLRFRIGSPTGIFDFPVGATLDVGASQAAGTYTGTWTIILNYQ